MKTFQGKTALVTGASSGLGRDFATLLAQAGCHLVLVARREERLLELAESLRGRYGVKARVLAADLAAPDAPARLFDDLKSLGVSVDVLINNAGCAVYGDFLDGSWEKTEKMLALDIVALTGLTRLFAAEMARRGGGRVLLVASIAGFSPSPFYAAYAASKAYVLSLGEGLAHEFKKHGVALTVLCPGATDTEFFAAAGQEVNIFQRFSMMQSRAVAKAGLRALAGGRPSAVPGLLNRIIVWGLRLVPRRLMPAIAAFVIRP